MTTFKFATFNLHHGKPKDARYSTKRLCEDVASLNADIVCLQEADFAAVRTFFRNQPNAIAKYLGFDFRSSYVRFFGAGCQYNAIISRYPIQSMKEIVFPKVKGKQRRIALKVEVLIDGKYMSVATTHLNTDGKLSSENETAQNQLKFLIDALGDENVIIGGDFNMHKDKVLDIFKNTNFDAPIEYPTSPTRSPKNQIDWIVARGYEISDVEVSEELCSDHRALTATITI